MGLLCFLACILAFGLYLLRHPNATKIHDPIEIWHYCIRLGMNPEKAKKLLKKIGEKGREDLKILLTRDLEVAKMEEDCMELTNDEKEEINRLEFYLAYLNSEFPGTK